MLRVKLLHETNFASKNPIEFDLSNPLEFKKMNKVLAGIMVKEMTHLESSLRYADLLYGSSIFFRKNKLKQSREHQAKRIKHSKRTVDRARARFKGLGLIEIKNKLVKTKDGFRNEISETDVLPLKEKISFIKKYNPKKYAFLISALLALRLINIMGGGDINNLLNNINILSISTKEERPEKTEQPKIISSLAIFEPLFNESHASTASVARDKCLDWNPSIKPPSSALPPYIDDYEEDGFEWNQENEYLVAAMYKPFSQYKTMLVRIFQGLKRRRIAEKTAKEKAEYNAGSSGSSLLEGLLDKRIN